MFSLIVTVIAIALTILLAVAGLYYGSGTYQEKQALIAAQAVTNQAQQIYGASVLYAQEHADNWPASTQVLMDNNYLNSIPVPPANSYALLEETGFNVAEAIQAPTYTINANAHAVLLPNKITPRTCNAVIANYMSSNQVQLANGQLVTISKAAWANSKVSLDTIKPEYHPNSSDFIQCYGVTNQFTYIYSRGDVAFMCNDTAFASANPDICPVIASDPCLDTNFVANNPASCPVAAGNCADSVFAADHPYICIPPPGITLSITPFGNTDIGQTPSLTMTLSNASTRSTLISALNQTGSNEFAITATTCGFNAASLTSGATTFAPPVSLAAGASCDITVTYTPASIGASSKTFTVTSSTEGDISATASGSGQNVVAPTGFKVFSVVTSANNQHSPAITVNDLGFQDTCPTGGISAALTGAAEGFSLAHSEMDGWTDLASNSYNTWDYTVLRSANSSKTDVYCITALSSASSPFYGSTTQTFYTHLSDYTNVQYASTDPTLNFASGTWTGIARPVSNVITVNVDGVDYKVGAVAWFDMQVGGNSAVGGSYISYWGYQSGVGTSTATKTDIATANLSNQFKFLNRSTNTDVVDTTGSMSFTIPFEPSVPSPYLTLNRYDYNLFGGQNLVATLHNGPSLTDPTMTSKYLNLGYVFCSLEVQNPLLCATLTTTTFNQTVDPFKNYQMSPELFTNGGQFNSDSLNYYNLQYVNGGSTINAYSDKKMKIIGMTAAMSNASCVTAGGCSVTVTVPDVDFTNSHAVIRMEGGTGKVIYITDGSAADGGIMPGCMSSNAFWANYCITTLLKPEPVIYHNITAKGNGFVTFTVPAGDTSDGGIRSIYINKNGDKPVLDVQTAVAAGTAYLSTHTGAYGLGPTLAVRLSSRTAANGYWYASAGTFTYLAANDNFTVNYANPDMGPVAGGYPVKLCTTNGNTSTVIKVNGITITPTSSGASTCNGGANGYAFDFVMPAGPGIGRVNISATKSTGAVGSTSFLFGQPLTISGLSTSKISLEDLPNSANTTLAADTTLTISGSGFSSYPASRLTVSLGKAVGSASPSVAQNTFCDFFGNPSSCYVNTSTQVGITSPATVINDSTLAVTIPRNSQVFYGASTKVSPVVGLVFQGTAGSELPSNFSLTPFAASNASLELSFLRPVTPDVAPFITAFGSAATITGWQANPQGATGSTPTSGNALQVAKSSAGAVLYQCTSAGEQCNTAGLVADSSLGYGFTVPVTNKSLIPNVSYYLNFASEFTNLVFANTPSVITHTEVVDNTNSQLSALSSNNAGLQGLADLVPRSISYSVFYNKVDVNFATTPASTIVGHITGADFLTSNLVSGYSGEHNSLIPRLNVNIVDLSSCLPSNISWNNLGGLYCRP